MSKQEDKWRPQPAAKPSSLSTRTQDDLPTVITPALKGASSAFSSKASPSKPETQTTASNARWAALSANGISQRGRTDTVTSNESWSSDRRSPSRGRHLYPQHPQLAGARTATSRNRPLSASPTDLKKSASMIAARLASANNSPVRNAVSRSPRRKPEIPEPQSPNTSGQPIHPAQPMKPEKQADLVASPPQMADDEPLSVRDRMLNFQQIPTLSPTGALNRTVSNSVPVIARRELRSPSPSNPALKSPQTPVNKPIAMTNKSESTGLKASPKHDSMFVSSDVTNAVSHKVDIAPVERLVPSKPQPPAPRRAAAAARAAVRSPTGNTSASTDAEMAVNRLADAMVASSLASTRSPSPAKDYPKFDRRRSASASDLRNLSRIHEVQRPALPLRPQRPMKHTLRKHSSDNEDDTDTNKRGRRHFVRKHPNMHHEGDRKRWRDKVTERERKRYEGVFAANRGLLLQPVEFGASPSRVIDPLAEANQVANVVVRDIWERSRLTKDVLREIYDLVCPEETRTLNREQFVVGLWLIDQKLKGRKLPARVTPSVWGSVRHSQGIKIRSIAS